MVLTGDAFLQHLHDCKMLPGHSLKSKKSAFSLFLWKRKGWVTPTSLVTLVYALCSATHAKEVCGNILLSGKQGLSKAKAAGGYKPSSGTAVEARGSLKLEVFSTKPLHGRTTCQFSVFFSQSSHWLQTILYHVTVKTPNPKREAAFCGAKKGLRVSRRIDTCILEGFRRFNMTFSRDLQGLFYH